MRFTTRFTSMRHSPIVMFGVMVVALGLFAPPAGIVPVIVATYSIRPDYFAIGIIVGMFIKVLSNGNLLLRIIGIAPYTIFVLLAVLLWVNGITSLLQSQILYVVIWLLLVKPLTQDILETFRDWRLGVQDA